MSLGEEMHRFAQRLWPLPRSLTGDGVRATLAAIKEHLPDLSIHEVPSGEQVFDWTVPDEWSIRAARLTGPDGEVIADFAQNNLHVVGYSTPVDVELSLDELQPHLYSRPDLPDAIPYVTSYYSPRWGFCLTDRTRQALKPGRYRAVIDATLAPGSLTYGELLIPGRTQTEILLSTYVCHPSMANNELSGPVVTTWLAKWLQSEERRHSIRIVFIPETIGAIVYLSRNIEAMKARTAAGFVVTCIGDDRDYSFLPSIAGDTLADRAAIAALSEVAPDHKRYSFLDRGSDERQYCAPGVDLPVCTIARTLYGRYPEYHTSADDLTLVTPDGLQGGFDALRLALTLIEENAFWKATVLGEPQLGRRGLYPSLSSVGSAEDFLALSHVLAYADGRRDLIEISELTRTPPSKCLEILRTLRSHGLVAAVEA